MIFQLGQLLRYWCEKVSSSCLSLIHSVHTAINQSERANVYVCVCNVYAKVRLYISMIMMWSAIENLIHMRTWNKVANNSSNENLKKKHSNNSTSEKLRGGTNSIYFICVFSLQNATVVGLYLQLNAFA